MQMDIYTCMDAERTQWPWARSVPKWEVSRVPVVSGLPLLLILWFTLTALVTPVTLVVVVTLVDSASLVPLVDSG